VLTGVEAHGPTSFHQREGGAPMDFSITTASSSGPAIGEFDCEKIRRELNQIVEDTFAEQARD
jgi:hypothetical protein